MKPSLGGGGLGAYINEDPSSVVYVVGLHGVIDDRAAEDKADGNEELPEGQALHGPGGDLPTRQPHNQRQQRTQVCPDVACTPCMAGWVLAAVCSLSCVRQRRSQTYHRPCA